MRIFRRRRRAPEPDRHGSPGVPSPPTPRADRAGDLTDLPDGLPPGDLVLGRSPDEDDDPGVPVLWCSAEPGAYEAVHARLVDAFPTTGLWPMLLPADGHDLPSDDVLGRPVPVAGPDEVFDRLGVAPAPGGVEPDGARAAEDRPGPAHLLLVPAARPADVPAAIGWMGPANHDLGGAEVSAVLRSWEDRYGAVLTAVGFDTLVVDLPGPVADAVVVRLADEHHAFCPDNVDQGVGSIEAYRPLVAGTTWFFWWD